MLRSRSKKSLNCLLKIGLTIFRFQNDLDGTRPAQFSLYILSMNKIKNFLLVVVLMYASTSAAQVNKGINPYLELFNRKYAKAAYNLKNQCVYQDDKSFAQAQINQNETDSDMLMSYDDFIKKVTDNGLLDPDKFINPAQSEIENKQQAPARSEAIVKWTQSRIDSGMVDNKENCYLNAKELFALMYYTGDGYRKLNQTLRDNEDAIQAGLRPQRTRSDELEKYAILGKHLSSALTKLKPFVGFVKRGQVSNKDPEKNQAFLSRFTTGNKVSFSAYTSTTIATPFDGDMQFLLKVSKNCYYIANFSMYEQSREEEEVLCKPYTNFRVRYSEVDGVTRKMVLEEL